LTAVNELITNDPALGTGFVLGHSYFCQHADRYDDVWYRRIVDFELVPFLEELWFDNRTKVDECSALLRGDA
jgi:5-methylcytosine-specific restriction enzyme B